MIRLSTLIVAMLALNACDQIREFETKHRAAASEGGAFLVLEVDQQYLREEALTSLSEEMGDALRSATPSIRYDGRGVSGDAARVRLVEASDNERAIQVLAALRGGGIAVSAAEDGSLEARMSEAEMTRLVTDARQVSIGVLQRRFPMRDVMVEPHGERGILLHAGPRFSDPAYFSDRLAVAKLTFHVVRDIRPGAAVDRVPPGYALVEPYPGIGSYSELVQIRPSLSRPRLIRVSPTFDQHTNEPVVSFQFDDEGTRRFCRITTDHVGQRFAVLLDNRVLVAPIIHEPICGGTAQISGTFTIESANELALYLGAGSLPAPLTVVRQGVDYGR